MEDQILQYLKHVNALYYRLILAVAPSGMGKTQALFAVHQQTNAPIINVNLELSRRLLDLTERQRALKLPRLLQDIVSECEGDTILLDNIEILFDVSLQQDPLRLFQGLSRNKTIVVAWNGFIDGDYIAYAVPEHPEYRRYPLRDLLIASPELKSTKNQLTNGG